MIDKKRAEARLEVGLPAVGRRILGREAKEIFLEAIPQMVKASLFLGVISKERFINKVKLAEDQYFLRQEVERRELVAFVANGSILPRESGVSQRPMVKGVVPFQSPREYEVELQLPNYGPIKGMGIPQGVTLIIGGGFHSIRIHQLTVIE